jgi:hypothetical protein
MRRLILPLLALSMAGCGSGAPDAQQAAADSAAAVDSTTLGGRVRSTVNMGRAAGERATQAVDQGQARLDSALQDAAAQSPAP